ncbi:MAG: hypothetical protein PVJ67_01295 [Candidatus Pacearchaeota archaeon]|jgi:hypothetical protein
MKGLIRYLNKGPEEISCESREDNSARWKNYAFFMDCLGGEQFLRGYCFVRDFKDRVVESCRKFRDKC